MLSAKLRSLLHPFKRMLGKWTYLLWRKRFGSFRFNGKELPYFCSVYNQAWMNERCVEVPLTLEYIKPGMRVLEVGRVLDHYRPFPHDCVDKVEKGAINIDIVDFNPPHRYDVIVSISTLEHVGWDVAYNETRDPRKIYLAIEKLKSLLAPGGKLVVTLPIDYNHNLQPDLTAGKRLFDEQYYFLKDARGDWNQTPDMVFSPYSFRDGWATSVMLGVTTAPAAS